MLKLEKTNYKIIADTREKDLFITEIVHKNGIQTVRRKLDTGDYMIQHSSGYIAPVIIERKAHIDELIGNFLDHRKDKNGNRSYIR